MVFYVIKLTHSRTQLLLDGVSGVSPPPPSRLAPSPLATLPPDSLALTPARAARARSEPDSGRMCWECAWWLRAGGERMWKPSCSPLLKQTDCHYGNSPPYGGSCLFTQKNASWQLFPTIQTNLPSPATGGPMALQQRRLLHPPASGSTGDS